MIRSPLIFYVIFVIAALFQNLSAAPVYAAELRLGDQSVFLYGDYHSTHEIDEDRERRTIDAFCQELNGEILVLCEDFKMAPFSTICSDQDCRVLFPDTWNKGFIDVVCNFAHAKSNPDSYLRVQSIDPRGELVDLIAMAFIYSLKIPNPIADTELFKLEQKVYEAIKNGSISGAFERLITNIKLFSEFTANNKLRLIFDNIADTLRARKVVLWEKIIADTGLSKDELDQLTIETVVTGIMKSDSKFTKFVDFFKDKDLMISYSLETVEAEALWHIAGTQNPSKKIVVIAGAEHIYNLERHLLALGFEKVRSAGKGFKCADENNDKAKLYANNVVDTDHKLRVSPLDPLDEFGHSLFCDKISAAWEKINYLPEHSRSKEVNAAIRDHRTKAKKFYSYGSPPLVSFNTFTWINQTEKKRKRSSSKNTSNKKRRTH